MGACRESYSIARNPKKTFELRTWIHSSNRKLWFDDNFMPFVCKVIGHKPYQPDAMESDERACKRCHRFLPGKNKVEPRKSNLEIHAERELRLAGFYDKDADYGGLLPNAVLELVKIFSSQGHSGSSAGIVIRLFSKVARFENLGPITGKDEEWNDISDMDKGTLQNNRCHALFKEKTTGKAYYLDAIVFRNQHGTTYTSGNVDGYSSRQYIKGFPFDPKTFYIDVIDEGVGLNHYITHIKDLHQLEEVWGWYERQEQKPK